MLFDFLKANSKLNFMLSVKENISSAYTSFLQSDHFPCVAAKAAFQRGQTRTFVAGHMACPRNDQQILEFIYQFVDDYRSSEAAFHSAAVIFEQPENISEDCFEEFMWMRLQSLSNLDATNFPFDERVSLDPNSPDFSFSLKSEAFFIIGLHPASNRPGRRFQYPALVFNPHAGFEQMRAKNQYEKMKNIVRKKDMAVSGSINPMLDDFGNSSEAFQYSGKNYSSSWKCPLHIKHGTANHSAA